MLVLLCFVWGLLLPCEEITGGRKTCFAQCPGCSPLWWRMSLRWRRVVVGREAHLMEARKQSRGVHSRDSCSSVFYMPCPFPQWHRPQDTPSHESCLESPCRPGAGGTVCFTLLSTLYTLGSPRKSLSEWQSRSDWPVVMHVCGRWSWRCWLRWDMQPVIPIIFPSVRSQSVWEYMWVCVCTYICVCVCMKCYI